MVLTHTPAAKLGQPMPLFSLPGTDGKTYTPQSLHKASARVIVFTCNHCPYAVYAKPKLLTLYEAFKNRGVRFIAINSNDSAAYPEDSFEKMKEPAHDYPFPYLHDETQETAKQFGAVCTPDLFVYDSGGALAYRGQIDDGRPNRITTTNDLERVLDDLLDGKPVSAAQNPSTGCSIKWRNA